MFPIECCLIPRYSELDYKFWSSWAIFIVATSLQVNYIYKNNFSLTSQRSYFDVSKSAPWEIALLASSVKSGLFIFKATESIRKHSKYNLALDTAIDNCI